MSEGQGRGKVETVSDRTTWPAKAGRFDLLTLGCALLTFILTVELVRQRFSASVDTQPSSSAVVTYWASAGITIAIPGGA